MAIIHPKRISQDEDFELAVEWTRDDNAVSISDARLVISDTGTNTDTQVATLGSGITVVGADILVRVPQADLPDLEPGPGYYVLAVQETNSGRRRLVEGGLSIQRKVVTW